MQVTDGFIKQLIGDLFISLRLTEARVSELEMENKKLHDQLRNKEKDDADNV